MAVGDGGEPRLGRSCREGLLGQASRRSGQVRGAGGGGGSRSEAGLRLGVLRQQLLERLPRRPTALYLGLQTPGPR